MDLDIDFFDEGENGGFDDSILAGIDNIDDELGDENLMGIDNDAATLLDGIVASLEHEDRPRGGAAAGGAAFAATPDPAPKKKAEATTKKAPVKRIKKTHFRGVMPGDPHFRGVMPGDPPVFTPEPAFAPSPSSTAAPSRKETIVAASSACAGPTSAKKRAIPTSVYAGLRLTQTSNWSAKKYSVVVGRGDEGSGSALLWVDDDGNSGPGSVKAAKEQYPTAVGSWADEREAARHRDNYVAKNQPTKKLNFKVVKGEEAFLNPDDHTLEAMEQIFAHGNRLPLRPKGRAWGMAEHLLVAKAEAAELWAITSLDAREAAATARTKREEREERKARSRARTTIQTVQTDGVTPLFTQRAPRSKRQKRQRRSPAPRDSLASSAHPGPPAQSLTMRQALFAHKRMLHAYLGGDDQFRSLSASQCIPSMAVAPTSPSSSSSVAQTCFKQGILRVSTFIVLFMLLVCCSVASNLDALSLFGYSTTVCFSVVCEWLATQGLSCQVLP
jgi:hypothetical protein